MTKRAMILMGQSKELKELGFKMLFPVHDELIAECPFVNRKRCGELMSQLMIAAGAEKINVPMKCDVERFLRVVSEKMYRWKIMKKLWNYIENITQLKML